MPFHDLLDSSNLLQSLEAKGYRKPTPIQQQVIPLVLSGKDVMAQAQTGTGKSASFVLPLLQLLEENPKEGKPKISTLVLAPTRELTQQISDYFTSFGKSLNKVPKVVTILGGESIGDQLYAIQKGCDIVVATSGRLLDVLSKKQMNLSHLQYLVVDEADKMLNLGFSEELDLILEAIPSKRQNLLFSATYPEKILEIASKITTNPTRITIKPSSLNIKNINQRVIEVDSNRKASLLRYLLKKHKFKQVLVFMSTKRATENIAYKFRKNGYFAESFHGELSQEDRTSTLKAFKDKKLQLIFATDLVSRGLDIDSLECVINYDLPRSPTDYTHRIGRTARAGKSGIAISFIDHETEPHFYTIEKKNNFKLKRESIEGYELTGIAPKNAKGPAPIKGKKKSKKDKLREQGLLPKKI